MKNVKTIFYLHSCFLYFYYSKQYHVLKIYRQYRKSKYVISIIPLENYYLFKKWGINSVYFENFLPYNYNKTIPSNLLEKKILMIGRGRSKLKRFDLGIFSLEYIKNEIPDVKLIIISKLTGIKYLQDIITNLNLENNVIFGKYSSDPSIYYKNASLHFLPSISEGYPLDYISLAKNGTIIIYDDTPESLAKISLKILKKRIFKKKLSKIARLSMKKFDNEKLFNKWKLLLLSVINNYNNYSNLFEDNKNNTNELLNILKTQVFLLNKRMKYKRNITILDLEKISIQKMK